MKAYFAIFRCRFSSLVQYRVAAVAGVVTQLFWGMLKVMILTAFYAASSALQPMTLSQAVTFIWIGQGLFLLLPWNIDKEIEVQVRSGQVVYELARPVDLYWLWFSRSFALRLIPALMRSVVMYPVAYCFFGMALPMSLSTFFLFLLSMSFAVLLASAITTAVMLTLFWTISGEGLLRLLPQITFLFSGLVVPLPLFPEWLQPLMLVQPFRCIIDIPSRIYTGMISPEAALPWIAFQMGWLFLFILLGRWMATRSVRHLVVQGG